jgi:hypothetical protein
MKILSVIALLVLVAAGVDAQAEASRETPAILVLAPAEADSAWLAGLKQYIADELLVTVQLGQLAVPSLTNNEDIVQHLLAANTASQPHVIRLIVLDDPSLGIESRLHIVDGERAAIVNLAAWKPAAPQDSSLTIDVWRGRADRQFIHAGGRLLGMPVCPLPLCVLQDNMHESTLDQCSRGLCPPCRDQLRVLLGLPAEGSPSPDPSSQL